MSLTPHAFIADRSRLYCTECQLRESNAIHDETLRPATLEGKADLALKNYKALEITYQEVRHQLAELARAYLQAVALLDNEHAVFLAFTCEHTYFGHGQSGPVLNATHLYDANGMPLRIEEAEVLEEADDHIFEDDGWLFTLLDLTTMPDTSEDYYVLNLETGLWTSDPIVPLQDWPAEYVE